MEVTIDTFPNSSYWLDSCDLSILKKITQNREPWILHISSALQPQ